MLDRPSDAGVWVDHISSFSCCYPLVCSGNEGTPDGRDSVGGKARAEGVAAGLLEIFGSNQVAPIQGSVVLHCDSRAAHEHVSGSIVSSCILRPVHNNALLSRWQGEQEPTTTTAPLLFFFKKYSAFSVVF